MAVSQFIEFEYTNIFCEQFLLHSESTVSVSTKYI